MTLYEKVIKDVFDALQKRDFRCAARLLHTRYNYLSPASYSYLLSTLLLHLVVALSAQGHYLTKETYELVTSLPLHRFDTDKTSLMERTNRLFKQIKKNQKNYELQFK